MANHFKDYKAKLDTKRRSTMTDDEIAVYSKTNNNEGVSHERVDWVPKYDTSGYSTDPYTDEFVDYEESAAATDKEKTIERDTARKRKIRDASESLSDE